MSDADRALNLLTTIADALGVDLAWFIDQQNPRLDGDARPDLLSEAQIEDLQRTLQNIKSKKVRDGLMALIKSLAQDKTI